MRRVLQLERASRPLGSRYRRTFDPQFVCAACRATVSQSVQSTSIHTSAARAAQGGVPILERVRRKLMGGSGDQTATTTAAASSAAAASSDAGAAKTSTTGDEAGVEPSSGKSAEKRSKKTATRPSGPKRDPTYEPATTWDGLEEVGELVDPRETSRVSGQVFTGFMAPEQISDPEELARILKDSFTIASSKATSSETRDDSTWLGTPFESQTQKFTVIKNFMQRSGVRIPDNIIHSSKDSQALLNHVITPPKPKKLVDTLLANDSLQELANVKVHQRRVTPIDKEIQLGRWKVIERELEARGLPVTGHAS